MKLLWTWIEEIKAVGLRDWCWFVIRLRRNEFHPRLSVFRYYRGYPKDSNWDRLMKARSRAHRIDLALSDLRRK